MIKLQFSREDTAMLKGEGILLIILHNLFHWYPGMSIECEYMYESERVARFFEAICNENVLVTLFAFFGHYGVSIFVFMSGYGLSRRYARSSEKALQIIVHRTLQLLKLLVPVILIYLVCYIDRFEYIIWDVLRIVTFTSNFIGAKFSIAGPWWYFGMAFQLYIIYACFLRRASDKVLWIVTVGVLLLLIVLSVVGLDLVVYEMRYNSIGWLPVFCLGMLAERHPVSVSWKWLVAGMLLCLPCFVLPYLWVLSSTLVLCYFIALPQLSRGGTLRKSLLFVGGISAAVFVIHSFSRRPLINNPYGLSPELVGLIFLALNLSLGWLYTKASALLYRKLN